MNRPGGGPPHMRQAMVKQKPKDTKKTLLRLLYEIGNVRGFILIFVFVLVANGSSLYGTYSISHIIDNYIAKNDVNGLIQQLLFLGGIFTLAAVLSYFQGLYASTLAQRLGQNLRNKLFKHISTLPIGFFDKTPSGDTMSRFTNDIESIGHVLAEGLGQLLSSGITLVGTVILMAMLSPHLTVLTIIILPIIMKVISTIAGRTRKYFREQQQKLADLNTIIEETISGQRVVKVFCQEENIIDEFEDKAAMLQRVGYKAQFYAGVIMPIMQGFNTIAYALTALAGACLAILMGLSTGAIASFLQLTRQFSRPLNEIANQIGMFMSALAGAERVFNCLDIESDVNTGTKHLTETAGNVVFEHVTFGYVPSKTVLDDLNLTVKGGQTVAFVGSTGAGKTTIINLLMRFYDVCEGRILIDGTDIREFDKTSLREQMGVVLQDTHLFSGTIRENIRYGRLTSTDHEVVYAAQLANAHNFIMRFPDGYDTVITSDGINLSQGQRQLLAIARAILHNPSILILDEATSSIDTKTESHIQMAMQKLMKGRTSFIIAHRLSTVRHADVIVVIDHGKIIEQGTHDELYAADGVYTKLCKGQLELD